MAEMHYHKLSPIICDYEQLVIIIINLRLMTCHNLIG